MTVVLAGCSKAPPPIVPVNGVVKLNGQPLGNAEVRFIPQHEGLSGDYIGIAVTDDQGRFTLETNGQQGGCACVHMITVDEGPPPREARGESAKAQKAYADYAATLKNRPIPRKYATSAESPLTLTVTAGQSEYTIELKR
jgi:hypothetical protein